MSHCKCMLLFEMKLLIFIFESDLKMYKIKLIIKQNKLCIQSTDKYKYLYI